MSRTRAYDLNGLIRLIVEGPARYLRYFDNEYARISVVGAATEIPIVKLRIVDRIVSPARKEIHHKGLFRFAFSVDKLHQAESVISFERHWLDRFYVTAVGAFLQGQVMEPVIYQKLLERGVLFMHAAGVAKNGKAYVFPAHGGTGKTTLSLSLMRQGYELMGDDLLMVDTTEGIVYPYARPLHLFSYNLKTLNVPLRIRLIIAAKDVIRSMIALATGQKFLISTRVHADEILKVRQAQPSRLEKVIFLKRHGKAEKLNLRSAKEMEHAIDAIVDSADLNDSLFKNISDEPNIREAERATIRTMLSPLHHLQFVNARELTTDSDRLSAVET